MINQQAQTSIILDFLESLPLRSTPGKWIIGTAAAILTTVAAIVGFKAILPWLVITLAILALVFFLAAWYALAWALRLRQHLKAERSQTGDIRRYQQTVHDMAVRSLCPVRYNEYNAIYAIGDRDSQDVVTETHITSAVKSTQPILWHHLTVGSTSQPMTMHSFSDLAGVRVFEELPAALRQEGDNTGFRELTILPTGIHDHRLGVLVFFDPEIDHIVPREWTLKYNWKGLWDPLRTQNEDRSTFYFGDAENVTRDVVNIFYVFPDSAVGPTVSAAIGTPQISPVWDHDKSGRNRVRITITEPNLHTYELILRVKGWK